MENNSLQSSIIRFFTLITTVGGLISQFLLNEQIQNFFRINSVSGGDYLKAFSFGGLILGLILILIIYKYRFNLSQKIYFNEGKGRSYLEKINKNKPDSLEKISKDEENKDDGEPAYYSMQLLAIYCFFISILLFILIFLLKDELQKSIAYLFFILSIVFTVSVFLMDLLNNRQRLITEKESLNLIRRKIEKYFLPKIKFIGQVQSYSLNPPQSWVEFEVEESSYKTDIVYRAMINIIDPENYFEIIDRSTVYTPPKSP